MNLKQIKLRYFLMYFVAFLVAFMSSVLIYVAASRNLEKDAIERFNMQCELGISDVENLLYRMNYVEDIIRQNESFKQVARIEDAVKNEDVLYLGKVRTLMSELKITSDLTYIFALFEENDAYISSSQCSEKFAGYYGKFLKIEGQELQLEDSEGVKSKLFQAVKEGNFFLPLDRISYSANGTTYYLENAILYLVGGKSSGGGKYLFGFVIDSRELMKMLNRDEKYDVRLNIVEQKSDTVLVDYGTPDKKEMKQYYIYKTESNNMGWSIEAGVSFQSIRDRMRMAYNLLWVYLILGIVIVMALTVVFSRRGYKGLDKILTEFPNEEDRAEEGSRIKENDRIKEGDCIKDMRVVNRLWRFVHENEYGIVAGLVKGQREKSDEWKQQLEEMKKQNSMILLEHLITVGLGHDEGRRILQQYFGEVPEYFCVAIVRIFRRGEDVNENIFFDFLRLVNLNLPNSFVHVCSGVTDELFLIALDPFQESNVNKIKTCFDKCVAAMADEMEGNFHVGISAIGVHADNIYRCYEQARQVVQSLYINENINMVCAFTCDNTAVYENLVNLDYLNRFNDNLLCGKQKEAMEAVDKLREAFVKRPFQFEVQKEQIYYSMRNVFFNILLHFDKVSNVDEILPAFSNDMSGDSMILAFRQAVIKICDDISSRRKKSNEELRERIICYLEENYSDPALSAYQVSREMNISEKYLSSLIKEESGESFSGYLLELRIKYAAQYLEQTEYSNEKIAEITGFGAANSFYRNFNKKMGMSPKVYRELKVKGGNMRHSIHD